jgi:hypothetical protein
MLSIRFLNVYQGAARPATGDVKTGSRTRVEQKIHFHVVAVIMRLYCQVAGGVSPSRVAGVSHHSGDNGRRPQNVASSFQCVQVSGLRRPGSIVGP